MLEVLLLSNEKRNENLEKNTFAFVKGHVNARSLKRCATLVQNEIAVAFVNLDGMLTDAMRHILRQGFRNDMANQRLIKKFIALNGLRGTIPFEIRVRHPRDFDDGTLVLPWTTLDRGPLSHFLPTRIRKDNIGNRKSACSFDFGLGSRLDERLVILIVELHRLAYVQLTPDSRCMRLLRASSI